MRKSIIAISIGFLILSFPAVAYGAGWASSSEGYRWQNNDGTFARNEWRWIDSDSDGLAECYYFGDDSILLTNAVTPDGSSVDVNGAWNIGDVVQKKEGIIDENTWIDQHRVELEDFARRAENREDDFLFVLADKLLENPFEGENITYQATTGKFIQVKKKIAGRNCKCVYYGEMNGPLISGQGTLYRSYESTSNSSGDKSLSYTLYRGAWQNGAPNGYGEEYHRPAKDANNTTHIRGNYLNWYQSGEMTSNYIYHGEHYTYHYNVVDGIPVPVGQAICASGVICNVAAYPEEGGTGFVTFYDSVQTAAKIKPEGETRKANAIGYHRRPGVLKTQ